MLEYFAAAKRGITQAIESTLSGYGRVYELVSSDLGADVAQRLAEFSARGKMLRGCLVRLGYELAKGSPPSDRDDEALRLAGAAMELFQSGLLVHDDIMDRDRVRRGLPTLHVGYESALKKGSYGDPAHYGEALGICAGDLAYFAAFQLLSELPAEAAAALKAAGIAARELCLVGVAQMQDVVNGALMQDSSNPFRDAAAEPTEEDILRLYRYKTGRYTFSLPLALGAAIAGADNEVRLALEEAGERLGLVFQLKDDELGLFADEEELGKPVGADIREDKKTLFRLRLLSKAEGGNKARLAAIFAGRTASQADAAFVRAELERLGVRAELRAMMGDYGRQAEKSIAALLEKAPAAAAEAFKELVAYSLERRS